MSFDCERFAFIAAVSVALCAAALGGQQTKAKPNPPALQCAWNRPGSLLA